MSQSGSEYVPTGSDSVSSGEYSNSSNDLYTLEELCKKLDVHLPSQYDGFTKLARNNPFPYRSKLLMHNFFHNYSKEESMFYTSIRPGRKSGEPTVTDVKVLYYDTNGYIKYKLDFSDDDFTPLSVRPSQKAVNINFPKLFHDRLKIPFDKWIDLENLKKMIPPDTHGFYDMIPHYGASRRKKKEETSRKNTNEATDQGARKSIGETSKQGVTNKTEKGSKKEAGKKIGKPSKQGGDSAHRTGKNTGEETSKKRAAKVTNQGVRNKRGEGIKKEAREKIRQPSKQGSEKRTAGKKIGEAPKAGAGRKRKHRES